MQWNSPWQRAVLTALPSFIALVVALFVGALLSRTFAEAQNLGNIGIQVTPLAFAALAETMVILTGGIDLSVGSVISVATTILGVSSVQHPWAAIAAVVLLGAAVGLVNGIGVTRFQIPPLIMTLGTMTLLSGMALLILQSPGGTVTPVLTSVMYLVAGAVSPALGVVVLATAVLGWLTLGTRWGLRLYASGAAPQAAGAIGIPVDRIIVQAYVVAGLVAALAGLAMAGTLGSGDPNAGNLVTLNAIAAVVLGGTSFAGGRGGVLGSLAGALLLGVVANLLNQTGVNPSAQLVVEGAIVLAAVILQRLRSYLAGVRAGFPL